MPDTVTTEARHPQKSDHLWVFEGLISHNVEEAAGIFTSSDICLFCFSLSNIFLSIFTGESPSATRIGETRCWPGSLNETKHRHTNECKDTYSN